jgi:hypothetical protein
MVTGTAPDDPAFAARWEDFLRLVGERFQPDHVTAGQNTIVG